MEDKDKAKKDLVRILRESNPTKEDFKLPLEVAAEIARRDGREKAASNPKEYLELISEYDQGDLYFAVINFYKNPEIIAHGKNHELVFKQAYEKGHADAILLPYDPGLIEILKKV